jgi:hypothetical protein
VRDERPDDAERDREREGDEELHVASRAS